MIGVLNQRAVLRKKTQTDDGGGGYVESWTDVATVWAHLAASSAGEQYGADAIQTRAIYRLSLRRRDDVAAGWRVGIDTRTFDVIAVLDEGPQSETLTLLCEVLP